MKNVGIKWNEDEIFSGIKPWKFKKVIVLDKIP